MCFTTHSHNTYTKKTVHKQHTQAVLKQDSTKSVLCYILDFICTNYI